MLPDPFSSATEIATAIRFHRVSAAEVLEMYLARIAKHNPALNAICTLDEAGARARAKQADAAIARGELWGPLHGVPMTIKDALETAGLRTTGGYPPLSNHVPKRDATAVARLRAAGAVLMGKTNVPPLSADGRADNPIFGRTNNPWNLERTPGGSTGGGAAAVAAGLSAFDVGSDLAASVRMPAHWCGLFGLKPTEGRVPNSGHIPEVPGMPHAVRHMNVLGPLARSADDLATILKIIAGPDDRDWETAPGPLDDPPPRALATYRLAWSTELGGEVPSNETVRVITELASKLGNVGCEIQRQGPRGFDAELAWQTWGEIVIAERVVTQGDAARERVEKLHAALGDLPVARGAAKGMRATLADYMQSLTNRDRLIAALEHFFGDYDAWLLPVSYGPAIGHVPFGTPVDVDGRKVPYFLSTTAFTCPFNLTGHPAVVLPLMRTTENLPIGLQIVGRRWSEPALLALARQLSLITGPFRAPPGY
ncbi:MAG: amidase [Betaproteobacteria bacterium]|nr:MAG: amidase [Betaproteobacteria bacterium]